MDQVHLLVDEHMKYLQRVQPKAILVAKIMKQRNDLIQVCNNSLSFFDMIDSSLTHIVIGNDQL